MTAIEVVDPSRPSVVVGLVEESDAAAVDAVVGAADEALRAWRDLGLDARCTALLAAADALEAEVAPIGAVLCAELGKPIADARGEVAFSVLFLRDCVARAERVLAPSDVDDERGRLRVTHEPFGVCAGVVPWNAPVILAMLKVAPALVAGNAIVLKPSPLAPLALDRVVAVLAEHLPAGLINTVHGGAETGTALVTDARVRKVAFTGGEVVGTRVAELAAQGLKPAVLELGGNDAMVICADADLEPEGAIEGAVFGAFLMGGQVCMAAKRVYVHRSRLDDFVARFTNAAATCLQVGDPAVPGTTIGPLIDAAAAARQHALRAAAGEVLDLGTWLVDEHGVGDGHFVRPALVVLDDDAHPLVAEEQFGPTLPVLAFDDEDEVIDRVNASPLGLGASIWSADEDRAFALADRVESGMVFVNCHNRAGMTLRAPFGGWKRSGYGREYGDEGLLGYTQTRTTHAPAAVRAGGTLEGNRYPT